MSAKTSGFIYIWFDKKHKRYYIGSHWGSPDDGYICSSSWMRQAYKHRPEDFKRRIIKTLYDRTELLKEEERYLSMIKDSEYQQGSKSRYYNLSKGGTGHWSATDNAKIIGQKISAKNKGRAAPWAKGRIKSEETRAKLSKALKGRKMPPCSMETRKKISENSKRLAAEGKIGMFGKQHSESTKELMRQKNIGELNPMFKKTHSKETREKISQTGLGRIVTEDTRKKIGVGNKGKKRTEMQLQLLSQSHKGIIRNLKTFILEKDGVCHTITNLKQFCKSNRISYGSLCNGSQSSGWKIISRI